MTVNFDAMWEKIPKVPFCFLGWGLFNIWNVLMYRYPPYAFLNGDSSGHVFYDLVTVCVVALLAALARTIKGFTPLIRHRWVLPLAAFLLVACTGINLISLVVVELPMAVMNGAMVLGGAGSGFMFMLLDEFFGFLNPRRVVLYAAAGWIVGSIASLLFAGLSPFRLFLVLCAIPIICALCLWRSYKTLPATEYSYMGNRRFAFPWLALIPVVLSAILKRGGEQFVTCSIGIGTANLTATLVVGLFIVAGMTLLGEKWQLRVLWKAGIILCTAATLSFLITLWLPGITLFGDIAVFSSDLSYYFLLVMIVAVLANLSYRHGFCPLWLFSIEHFFRFLTANLSSLGVRTAQESGLFSALQIDVSFLVFSLVSIVVMTYLFCRYSAYSLWGLAKDDNESFSANVRLGVLCDNLIAEYGLTAREGDILFVLLQQKKPAEIAQELFIEVGTVRTHIKHIYTKLDVHSRQELLELVNA